MRVASIVFSFVVTLSLTAAALTYVPRHIGQQRIYVEGSSDSSPEPQPYRSYGYEGNPNPDSAPITSGDSDPYHQRYYSESEGWTYYTLPSYSLVVRGRR
jgi:hypothetical protein